MHWLSAVLFAFAVHGAAFDPPITFEENRGQFDPRVRFTGRASGMNLHMLSDRLVFSWHGVRAGSIIWKNANRRAAAEGVDLLPTRSNYYPGPERSRWIEGVGHYGKVRCRDIYPGIDLLFYAAPSGFEFDFILAPGADPARIRFELDSFDGVDLPDSGDLVLRYASSEIRVRRPVLHQGDTPIDGGFLRIGRREFGIRTGDYDRARELTIDPVVVFNTYVGGTGFDTVYDIAADAAGNLILSGFSGSAGLFPSTVNRPATESSGFVAKLNASGTQYIYVTYLGNANSVLGGNGSGIAVDAQGNAYVTGFSAGGLPVTPGAFQPAFGGMRDAYATKIGPTGTLIYSTYLGGTGSDIGNRIVVDAAGNAYVAGSTASGNYPTTAGALKTQLGGVSDAFVTKVNPTGTALVYSTLVGGTDNETMGGITVDSTGAAYIVGSTTSASFPTTAGVLQATKRGAAGVWSAFAAKLNPAGTSLLLSTFLGGTGLTQGGAVALDSQGNIHAAGLTQAVDFPTTPGVVKATSCCGSQHVFVSKLNPQATALIASTYYGGTGEALDFASAIRVDSNGGVYVTGGIGVSTFPNPGPSDTFLRGFLTVFTSDLTRVTDVYNAGRGTVLWGVTLRGTPAAQPGSLRAASSVREIVKQQAGVAGRADNCNQTITPGAPGQACTATTSHGIATVVTADAPDPPQPKLEMTKTYEDLDRGAGEYEFTIIVKNVGQVEITGVGVRDHMKIRSDGFVRSPEGCTFETTVLAPNEALLGSLLAGFGDFTSTELVCRIGTLKKDEERILRFRVKGFEGDPGDNTAIARGDMLQSFSAKSKKVSGALRPLYTDFVPTGGLVPDVAVEPQGLTTPAPGSQPAAVVVSANPQADAVDFASCTPAAETPCVADNRVALPAGSAPSRVAIAQAILQGKAVLTLNNGAGTVSVIDPQNGSVTTSNVGPARGVYDLQAFTANEQQQVAVLRSTVAVPTSMEIATFALQSDRRLIVREILGLANPGFALAAGDVNGDGATDLVASSPAADGVYLYLNTGGTFGTAVKYDAGKTPAGIVSADFNKDGFADVAVANTTVNQVSLLYADGKGGFVAPVSYGTGATPVAIAAGDINNDTIPDVVVGNLQDRSLTTVISNGRTYVTEARLFAGGFPFSLAVGDVNGDGGADVIAGVAAPDGVAVLATSAPRIAGVANAASYAGGGIAPGEMLVVAGLVGPQQLAFLQVEAGKVTSSTGGTRVLFDNVAGTMIYALGSQTSVIAPYSIAGRASTNVVVEFEGRRSAAVAVPVVASLPGLFSANASGAGQGAIVNENFSINSSGNPADKNSIITVFGTGSGLNDPPLTDGEVGAVLTRPVLPFSATVDGANADVVYFGQAFGLVAGVFQANIRIPASARSGNLAVQVTVGERQSQPGLTVAVR